MTMQTSQCPTFDAGSKFAEVRSEALRPPACDVGVEFAEVRSLSNAAIQESCNRFLFVVSSELMQMQQRLDLLGSENEALQLQMSTDECLACDDLRQGMVEHTVADLQVDAPEAVNQLIDGKASIIGVEEGFADNHVVAARTSIRDAEAAHSCLASVAPTQRREEASEPMKEVNVSSSIGTSTRSQSEFNFRATNRQSTKKDMLRDQLSQMMMEKQARITTLASGLTGQQTTQDVAESQCFTALVAGMVVLNSFIICAEVEYATTHLKSHIILDAAGYTCSAFFLFELVVRITAWKWAFFTDPSQRFWNGFDTALVLLSIAEPVLSAAFGSSGVQSVFSMKLLKLLRVFRIFRVFRFFRQLTKLALMIAESFRSLGWAVVMIAFIMYVFGITITLQISYWMKTEIDTNNPEWLSLLQNSTDETTIKLRQSYGSLAKTLYTLLQVVLGGVSWHEVCDPLIASDAFSAALLIVYLMFTILAVLNVITGVFVDNAFRSAQSQRDLQVKEEMERRTDYVKQIQEFFSALDEDGSGDVSIEELHELLEDDTLSAYFRILGFETDDAGRFIQLLDVDSSGSVSVDEFLEGCMRLRGPAQGVDVHTILHEIKAIQRSLAIHCGVAEANGQNESLVSESSR